jgi:hypothetical protein
MSIVISYLIWILGEEGNCFLAIIDYVQSGLETRRFYIPFKHLGKERFASAYEGIIIHFECQMGY